MCRRLKIAIFSISAIALLCGKPTGAFLLPDAKLSFVVVDEGGAAVENAEVTVGFDQPVDKVKGVYAEFENVTTGPKGFCEVVHKTVSGVSYSINKSGYYESTGGYQFTTKEGLKWQPWNQTMHVVMRKIQNPVPMYARDSQLSKEVKIPDTVDTKAGVGFDLVEYDWVAPYGKGIHSDFIFKLTNKYYKPHPLYVKPYEFDSELTISFSNEHDGIQVAKNDRRLGSKFKLPRYAPENGYNKSLTATTKLSFTEPVRNSFKDDNNYFFRIRSEQKNGKLFRAMYGKIQGEIEFSPKGPNTAVIRFKYFLNPDNTRNMEYDPKRNLFKNLSRSEYVGLE